MLSFTKLVSYFLYGIVVTVGMTSASAIIAYGLILLVEHNEKFKKWYTNFWMKTLGFY